MLYKFKSKATADLIMFESVGQCIVELLGKEQKRGILLVSEMPAAIITLQRAVQEDEVRRALLHQSTVKDTDQEPNKENEEVSFKQRCVPFLDMLFICIECKADVVWGV